jgi:hypothetical protein
MDNIEDSGIFQKKRCNNAEKLQAYRHHSRAREGVQCSIVEKHEADARASTRTRRDGVSGRVPV